MLVSMDTSIPERDGDTVFLVVMVSDVSQLEEKGKRISTSGDHHLLPTLDLLVVVFVKTEILYNFINCKI